MTNDLRFLCNEMLVGLGRWLRIAGYDTAIAERGRRDREAAERITGPVQGEAPHEFYGTGVDVVSIEHDRPVRSPGGSRRGADRASAGCAPRRAPARRGCTLCNTRLDLAHHRLLDKLPPRIRALGSTVHVCPRCGRPYWEGSHVRRMRRRLENFAREPREDVI